MASAYDTRKQNRTFYPDHARLLGLIDEFGGCARKDNNGNRCSFRSACSSLNVTSSRVYGANLCISEENLPSRENDDDKF